MNARPFQFEWDEVKADAARCATVWRCMMSLSTGGRRFMAASVTVLEKLEPMSRGRTDSRKRKPKQLAIINELCTGCAGSPVCVGYCPVEQCMFWVPDDEHPPFGRVEVDKSTCIGCAKCTAKGPDGMFLDGCPWDAIEMVNVEEWEKSHAVELPALPDRPVSEWGWVPSAYV